MPYQIDSGWTFTLRADVPLLYTTATGPGNPGGGCTGGVGAIMFEPIVDGPEVARNLTLRASLRLVLPPPRGQPFGSPQYRSATRPIRVTTTSSTAGRRSSSDPGVEKAGGRGVGGLAGAAAASIECDARQGPVMGRWSERRRP